MRVATGLAFILICVLLEGEVQSTELPLKRILNFLTNYIGVWSNEAEVKGRQTGHDLLQCRVIQFRAPALGDDTLLFVEVGINGVVDFMQVCVVSEDDYNIYITPYNFTDSSLYKPGEYDVSDLVSLTRANLTTTEDCKITFELIEPQVFFGAWPACHSIINGRHPIFAVGVGCHQITVIYPEGAKQTLSYKPYVLARVGGRFELSKELDWCADVEAASQNDPQKQGKVPIPGRYLETTPDDVID